MNITIKHGLGLAMEEHFGTSEFTKSKEGKIDFLLESNETGTNHRVILVHPGIQGAVYYKEGKTPIEALANALKHMAERIIKE